MMRPMPDAGRPVRTAGSDVAPAPADGRGPATAPIVGRGDPRLGSAAAAPGLLALQRSAGNAAVASLVARPVVQRAPVQIDEMTTHVGVAEATGAAAAAAGPAQSGGAGASGAVTSDGSNTTIGGDHITLAAPMTETEGVIRASTVIADSVVASSYTPGAGNVW